MRQVKISEHLSKNSSLRQILAEIFLGLIYNLLSDLKCSGDEFLLISFHSELHYFLEDFGFSVLIEIWNVLFRYVLIQLIPQCIEFCKPLRMITLGDFAFAALA